MYKICDCEFMIEDKDYSIKDLSIKHSVLCLLLVCMLLLSCFIYFFKHKEENGEIVIVGGMILSVVAWGLLVVIAGVIVFHVLKGVWCKSTDQVEENVVIPLCYNKVSPQGKAIIRSLEGVGEPKKIAVAIVVKDFLIERNESICNNALESFIPTVDQINKFPIESLQLMFSADKIMRTYERDLYYNLDLIYSILSD